jgi:hypothetical protein
VHLKPCYPFPVAHELAVHKLSTLQLINHRNPLSKTNRINKVFKPDCHLHH